MPKVKNWEKIVEELDKNPNLDFQTGPGEGKRLTRTYTTKGTYGSR